MSLPTWAIGEDYEDRTAADSYVVHLHAPLFVAKVTQKRGSNLMLTVAGDPETWADMEAERRAPAWVSLLHQAAQFWAGVIRDPDYAKSPPELLARPDFKPPNLLLCDSESGSRTFLVHAPTPFFVAELVDRRWDPVAGATHHPLVSVILDKISPPEAW